MELKKEKNALVIDCECGITHKITKKDKNLNLESFYNEKKEKELKKEIEQEKNEESEKEKNFIDSLFED